MRDGLAVFRREFFKWVGAHNKPSMRQPLGFNVDARDLFDRLIARIPGELLRQVGFGIYDGWLITPNNGPGYTICETLAGSPPQVTVFHCGGGKVIPSWELHVQLSDYVRLRRTADRLGLTVRMEDRDRDIVVWAGRNLWLMVENKVRAADAETLLRKMKRYGEEGFTLDELDVGNDPLRKAKYLFRDDGSPKYFGLSAIGYEKLFEVEYGEEHRFRLLEIPGPITRALLEAQVEGATPNRSPADRLAVELERVVAERGESRLWLSPGTGQTTFNAYMYLPAVGKHAIVAGVYTNGEIWSDFAATGTTLASSLANRLQPLGITVDHQKDYPSWRYGQSKIVLNGENVSHVAEAIIDAIDDAAIFSS